jgi:hypothetical protein
MKKAEHVEMKETPILDNDSPVIDQLLDSAKQEGNCPLCGKPSLNGIMACEECNAIAEEIIDIVKKEDVK